MGSFEKLYFGKGGTYANNKVNHVADYLPNSGFGGYGGRAQQYAMVSQPEPAGLCAAGLGLFGGLDGVVYFVGGGGVFDRARRHYPPKQAHACFICGTAGIECLLDTHFFRATRNRACAGLVKHDDFLDGLADEKIVGAAISGLLADVAVRAMVVLCMVFELCRIVAELKDI